MRVVRCGNNQFLGSCTTDHQKSLSQKLMVIDLNDIVKDRCKGYILHIYVIRTVIKVDFWGCLVLLYRFEPSRQADWRGQ